MPALSESRLAELLEPYLDHAPAPELLGKLSAYLDLLLRWNTRTNLTAIRGSEEIVTRHFGESLFAAMHLQDRFASGATLLDFGSGAGFPGIPIQLLLPELHCCLAESQGKKAAFLREAVRTLHLGAEVWGGRVEEMPVTRKFDCVTLRAVDRMGQATEAAQTRVSTAGYLAVLGSSGTGQQLGNQLASSERFMVPGGHSRMFYLYRSL